MLLQKAIGIGEEDVFLLETSFETLDVNLRTLDYLDKLLNLPEGAVETAIRITDRSGNATGIAIKNRHPDGDFWFVIPYPWSESTRKQTARTVDNLLGSGIILSVRNKKIDREKFEKGLREYLSVSLVEKSLCDCDREMDPVSFAFNEDRNIRLKAMLGRISGEYSIDMKKIEALEICCGNGMSTAGIKPMFKSVLSVDCDRCAVCHGLYHGILKPENTMVADATVLSRYAGKKYDAVMGFMLGAIYDFNKHIWRDIFKESLNLVNDGGFLLFTINQKDEMDFLEESYKSLGVNGMVIDNRDEKTVYDGWAFFAMP